MRAAFLIAGLLLTGACSTVGNESFSTITLNGREYELRTRAMEGPQGPYTSHAIRGSNGSFRTCNPESPGSCEAALKNNRPSSR